MADYLPVFETPKILEHNKNDSQKFKQSYFFDFEAGDFVRDKHNRVMQSDPETAWVQWCIKTVMTQRSAHNSYSNAIGCELEEALRLGERPAIESALKRTISEALVADPAKRTLYVNNFRFRYDPDSIYITFDIYNKKGTSKTISTSVSGVE